MRSRTTWLIALTLGALWLPARPASGSDKLLSGLKEGQRPGPYSSVVSVGEQRGRSHCFICETADRPAVIVFARSLSEPLAKLARGLDKARDEHKSADFQAWVTFLHTDQSEFDPQVRQWSKKLALRNLSLTVFEDLDGPPSYKLHRDADVTVICYVNQKTVANFAFRAGELNDARIAEILKTIPRLTSEAKK
jgi:hypothetical protein